MGENPMRIAVASGKGGTGKTMIAVNLAWFYQDSGRRPFFADCDVEEPNGHIFLKPFIKETKPVSIPVPEIDPDKCTACGLCAEKCCYGALALVKNKVLVFPELCHGCGLCSRLCPVGAISTTGRRTGVVSTGLTDSSNGFASGTLDIGEIASPFLIRAVKEQITGQLAIVDCPPGTSCPMVEAVTDSDFVVLVTEPTPFGLHDLEMAWKTLCTIGIPCGVVINRGKNFAPLNEFLAQNLIPVLCEFPEDRDIAECCSRGSIVLKALPAYRERFIRLAAGIDAELKRRTNA